MKTWMQVLLCLAPTMCFVAGYVCGVHEERRKVGQWVDGQHRQPRKPRGLERRRGEATEGWERDPDWWKC